MVIQKGPFWQVSNRDMAEEHIQVDTKVLAPLLPPNPNRWPDVGVGPNALQPLPKLFHGLSIGHIVWPEEEMQGIGERSDFLHHTKDHPCFKRNELPNPLHHCPWQKWHGSHGCKQANSNAWLEILKVSKCCRGKAVACSVIMTLQWAAKKKHR